MEFIITGTKEFNFEEAKNGALVKTKKGKDARIVSFDGQNKCQIAAWITCGDSGKECLANYTKEGYYQGDSDNKNNLVIIEKRNITKEEEELIYEDICHRLAYGVLVDELATNENGEPIGNDKVGYTIDYHPYIKNCIPYLYPYDFKNPEFVNEKDKREYLELRDFYNPRMDAIKINWLYAHNYDVNGLIPKGMARNLSEYEKKNNKKIFKAF